MRVAARLIRLRDCRSGAAAVEAAFILPVLLIIILGVFEFGRMAWARSALEFAVQEAARCAIVRPDLCGTDAQVQAFAAERTAGLGVPASAFAIAADQPCGVRVSANYAYPAVAGRLLTDLIGGNPRVEAEACRA